MNVVLKASGPSLGVLDGLTILRYGHVYDTRGGMEQYLGDLNRILSERSAFTTMQVQMTSDPERVGTSERRLGLSRLVECSLFVDQSSHEHAIKEDAQPTGITNLCKNWLRDRVVFYPPLYRTITRRILRRHRHRRRAGEPSGAGEAVRQLHSRQALDLICLHTLGGADIAEILDVAESLPIPVVYVHHFSNDRLGGFSVSAQVERLDAVAGVCGEDVPAYLSDRFESLSDGIDTEFFCREKALPIEGLSSDPLIFLPARLTPSKGQADLIRAVGDLNRRGVACQLALAGRTESASYVEALRSLCGQEGVMDRVRFLGPLGPEDLRDWYAAAVVVGFPTYHHEGLGRISVEAQSMRTPPVVYGIGGTPEGLLDGRTGFLIPLGDEYALRSSLERLLQDEALRLQMGVAGREFAESRFSLLALAKRHEDFLLRSVGRKPSPGR